MLSVVVPTYNRCEQLQRVLEALAAQTIAGTFEVVVVSDGSTDGTDAYLRSGRAPLNPIVLTQPNSGPSAARNAGVLAASGDLVVFLDDDVVPAVDFVEQHQLAHEEGDGEIVVIGPMLGPDDAVLSPWVEWEQRQLDKQYDAMRAGAYECTFRQFYTGNASLPRQRIIDVGLFDCRYRRGEDVELAFRLEESGISFRFAPSACGYHYAERSFESWERTAGAYGRNDVAFLRDEHEWLVGALAAQFRQRNVLIRTLVQLCVPRPRLANVVGSALAKLGTGAPVGPARWPILSGLYNLRYYQGVAAELGCVKRFTHLIGAPDFDIREPLRPAFVLEQTLGHVTHSDNLQRLVRATPELSPSFLPIAFEPGRLPVPGVGYWTIRAGLRARQSLRKLRRSGVGVDVLFFHSQVPAILAGKWMRRIPSIVSLDATPIQYDQMGDHYAHLTSSRRVESWKFAANRRCFARARHLIAWSQWTRDGLIRDYGVAPASVTVIAPGVDQSRWGCARPEASPPGAPVGILFVGGDLERKGGDLLLEAVRRLRSDSEVPPIELHLVTHSTIPCEPDVTVHHDLRPNSAALIDLYHRCEVFCLPTFGDCLPLVLAEAASSSMALVSTDVGAIRELVRDGDTGILVEPGDLDALTAALRRLTLDPGLRRRLGDAAHQLARQHHDAEANAARIVELLAAAAMAPIEGPRWTLSASAPSFEGQFDAIGEGASSTEVQT